MFRFAHNLFKEKKALGAGIGVVLGAIIMVIGYTLGRAFVYSTPEYAIIKLPFEILQAGIGAVMGMVLCFSRNLAQRFERSARNFLWKRKLPKETLIWLAVKKI